MSTQAALLNIKAKVDAIPAGVDSSLQRNQSSTSIRSMTPSDALSSSPPVNNGSPHTRSPQQKPLNSNSNTGSVASLVTFNKSTSPASPSVSLSAFTLPADKNEEAVPGTKERGSFEQTKGNWGNRIVLTTYPGQANVGMSHLSFCAATQGQIRFRWIGVIRFPEYEDQVIFLSCYVH